MPQSGQASRNALKGVLLVALAVFVFSLGDSLTKHLTMRYAVAPIIFARYAINLVLLIAVYAPLHGWDLWRTQRTGLVVLRGLCLAAASLSVGFAFRTIPVGEATAIVFLAPFAVMVLSGPLLGERVRPAAWVAAMVAFGGVMVILRPGGSLDPTGALLALSCAAFSTAYQFLTRLLARTETTMAQLVHTAFVGSLVFLVLTLIGGVGPLPSATDSGLVVLLGVLATLGHFLFTAGYRLAPASLVSPVNYLQLVWALLFGWLIFNHVPDGPSLAGMAAILIAGAGIAVLARRAARQGST